MSDGPHSFVRITRAVKGHQTIQAAAILGLTLLLFFATPLTHPHDYYGSDVLLVYRPLQSAIPPGYVLRGNENADSVTALQPFYYQNREQLRQGILPLWDPYIGLGAPHLANSSSAVFALPNIVFYLLSFKQALLVSAFIKLFLSGIFMYLFLRQLRLGHGPALIGAIGFMYCGYNIYWLPNSAPAVTPMLPMTLYFIEKSLHAPRARHLWWWSGIAASIALGMFAGHPETFFYIALFITIYAVIRGVTTRQNWRARAIALVQLGAFGAAGLLLSAMQLLPFLEYTVNSNAYATRTNFPASSLPPPAWLLNIFPNIYGNPADPYNAIYKVIVAGGPENLLEANGAYVGAFCLFLLVVAFFFVRRLPLAALFASSALLLLAYQYDVFGLIHLSQKLPLLNQAQPNRCQPVIAFCISAAAAFALHGLRQVRWARWQLTLLVIGGLGFIGCALLLAPAAWRVASLDLNAPGFRAYMPGQLAFITVGVIVGLVGVVFTTRIGRWQAALGLALVGAVVFSESGGLLHDFNPTVPGQVYVPRTASIAAVQRAVGDGNVMMLQGDEVRADANAFYNLRVMSTYDGLGVRPYYQLYTRLFGGPPELPSPTEVDPYILKLFGMDYVVSDHVPTSQVGEKAPQPYEGAEALLADPITQVFVPGQNNLNQIDIQMVNPFPNIKCDIQMTLSADWDGGRVVGRQALACNSLGSNPYVSVMFPAEKQSAGKPYRLTITAKGAALGNYVVLLTAVSGTPPGWNLFLGAAPRPGTLEYQLHYNASTEYRQVYRDDSVGVYHYTGSPGRFWTVGNTMTAASDDAALELVGGARPDPTRTVVLTAPPIAGLTGEATNAQLVESKADHVRIRVTRQSPGYLVAAMTDFPGWKARVNGRDAHVERANYAFMAVAVPAGTSEIELYYDPISFKGGVALSLLTLLGLLLTIFWQAWHGRRERMRRVVTTETAAPNADTMAVDAAAPQSVTGPPV